ncbi:E3 ubiquitin-protein ligase TTC3 isoform X2 [Entelurus aequoreus]|uniref:E3 ubiquitin-protein ligase TTC3 isoform X2 n=1 Tax=Entelurus aequoreus TaxID=161455 RepID=UPI002B1D6E54|nr:E3 ubiquitin-protein ligase TTC3 isoform X2 [Entelurus aequoreus]
MSDSDWEYTDCDDDPDVRIVNLNGDYRFLDCFERYPAPWLTEKWSALPADLKKEATHLMRLNTFWLQLLLLNDGTSNIAQWAKHHGCDPTNLSIGTLWKIEILEAVLLAMESGTNNKEQTLHLIIISAMFCNPVDSMAHDAAIDWLMKIKAPELESRVMSQTTLLLGYSSLRYIFRDYADFIFKMAKYTDQTMASLRCRTPDCQIEAGNHLKKRGNELFQKQKYEEAVHIYSKAIKCYPENHVIFGNRALCYIRCKKYIEAAFDGKRAILLEPLWAKGHYRYCEALFLLGEEKKAMGANSSARNLCKDDPEGVQDLTQQHQKFVGAMICNKSNKVGPPKKGKGSSNADANKKLVAEHQHLLKAKGGSSNKSKVVPGAASPCKAAECKTKKENKQVKEKAVPPVPSSITKEPGTPKKTRPPPAAAVKPPSTPKKTRPPPADAVKPPSTPKKTMAPPGAATTKQPDTLKKKDQGPENHAKQEPQPVAINKAAVCKELRSLVHDAHTALSNLCSYNAEMAFSQALALLDTISHKDIGLSTLDVQLLLYGRVSALTDIGKPEEIAEAQRLLEKIKSYEERIFQCLVYYARGRLYLKENRFAVAQKHFEDSLQMVKNRITPGILTWPLSKEIVKETQLNYFKKLLEDSIALCKFPPIPDATCRLGKCMSSSKNIYFTDPDFKGFIQIKCNQQCLIEYHSACWKTFKTLLSFEKNEKDFLEQPCRTPDCFGQVCSIKIVDPTGLVKCKFERDIPKPQTQKKPKVNQKCSIRVKKSKEESQLKTKNINNNKQLCEENVTTGISEDILPAKNNNSVLQSQQKAWLLYGDRILVQVCQMMQLLRQEKGLSVSTLSTYLRPWLELDSARGNQLATKMLNWQEAQLETLDQAVELLLERKNRVWARVFIELLSKSFGISVELSQWAGHLNDADLNAAKSFIERNAHQMEDWDLTLLLTFAPLRETISESVVTSQEFITKNGLSKYLEWAAPHKMRLFIWTLAELKDSVTCNLLLNEYFDMIDGHYSVLKKSDQNSYPVSVKNPGRKRKKGLNGLPVWSGQQSFAPIDHGDQENPIYYLQPSEPFRIPSHLQAEVAEFEDQYNGPSHKTDLKKLLDNNPDPTEENMYDYFAQILEGHGPLLPDSPLLINEMETFPPMAHAKIDKAGGFEAFLLESLRFIKIGKCVGLAKHAVSLQQQQQQHPLEGPYIISSPQTEEPHPYSVDPYPSPTNHLPVGTDDLLRPVSRGQVSYWDDPKFSLDDFDWMELYAAEKEDTWETYSYSSESNATPTEEIVAVKHSETQTCPAIIDSVAINTEPLKRYESCHGDVNKKAKCINEMKEKMNKMANDREEVEQKHNEGLESLQREIQEITVNIQVTDKELTLFQQKLEEEIKKDQKEKKANQEVLKALKLETEQLVEEQASLTKTIRQKKASFKEELDTFLELSNQSAAEKVSLEDEVKRCKATVAMANKRYLTAQLCILESSRDQRLHSLHRQLAEAKALLGKLDENVQRFPSLETNRQTWRTNVQDLEKKIATVETQYKEQTEQVKSGKRAKDVLSNSGQPEPQVSMLSTDMAALSMASAETRNPAKPASAASNTVFDKAMERLATVFPNYTRSDFMRFFKDLRSSNGGSLNGMGWQEVVSGVSELILKHQEKLKSGAASKTTELGGAEGDSNTSVWKRVQPQNTQDTTVLNLEDPCVICQEDIHPADHCVLECRHGFHKKCIMLWLKETSNCPTCRKHTLMSDFPLLVGRRRQAP